LEADGRLRPWFEAPGSDHLDRSRISREVGVRGEQHDPFHQRLRDQHAVERVLVQRRQEVEGCGMRAGDGKLGIAVVEQAAPQQPRVGKRAINKRVARARDEHRRHIAEAEAARRAAERDDPRPSIEAPPANGEWLRVIDILNEVLGAVDEPEPPMRDAEGFLVAVQERSVPSLRMLTSVSANSDVEPAPLAAPQIPLISRLRQEEAEELIERHVRFVDARDQSVRLNEAFVRHFIRRTDEALPVVNGVATLPIVTLDGRLLSGRGLDRQHRLVWRIPKAILDALPVPGQIEPTDVARAMDFLIGDWLADVATDYVGRCIAVACAATIIERYLLGERPSFFIDAPLRGSGKTTLLHMIAAAVTGTKASATAWARDEEERRKAMLATLSEGVPFIVFDNISRGAAIRCPILEKVLTAETYTDRLLGVSETRTVQAYSVFAFTGNNISPSGDLVSRSLTIRLQADRPDPENRDFRHPDPVAWTLQNRDKILAAIYTILLMDHPGRRGAGETRFRDWYRLVGSAVEAAADEHCEHVNALALDLPAGVTPGAFVFKELFLAKEADDEQTNALASVVELLRKRFPSEFGAADATRWLNDFGDPEAVELKAAIEAATSRPLNVITSLTVAKRLNALLDIPVQTPTGVMVLRRYRYRNIIMYKVEYKNAPPPGDTGAKIPARSGPETKVWRATL